LIEQGTESFLSKAGAFFFTGLLGPVLAGVATIFVPEDEIRRLIDAVDHYEAYLHSQQRDEEKFRELLVRLRKMLGKRP
jgi:hypothetical protein